MLDLTTFFPLFKRQIPLIKTNRMILTKIITTKGNNNVKIDITNDTIPSTIDIRILPIPPVTKVLVLRAAKVVSCVIEATPPPPIIEILHVKNESNSPIKEAVKIEPAITATGVAIVFMKLSINGM